MNSKLEESNKRKKRNALAEKILLSMIINRSDWGIKLYSDGSLTSYEYDLMETCFSIADKFIEHSNK